MNIESQVKSYCRCFPDVFVSAHGSTLVNAQGLDYIDFLGGCGALNYGHNHETLKSSLLDYIQSNGVVMSLDMMTTTKERFLKSFEAHILSKRNMD